VELVDDRKLLHLVVVEDNVDGNVRRVVHRRHLARHVARAPQKGSQGVRHLSYPPTRSRRRRGGTLVDGQGRVGYRRGFGLRAGGIPAQGLGAGDPGASAHGAVCRGVFHHAVSFTWATIDLGQGTNGALTQARHVLQRLHHHLHLHRRLSRRVHLSVGDAWPVGSSSGLHP